jgi:transposase
VQTGKQHDAQTLYRLQSVPGIGKILSLVLLYEMHDITRFPRVQDCVSYCRLIQCAKESAGKRYGTAGTKIGMRISSGPSPKRRSYSSATILRAKNIWLA